MISKSQFDFFARVDLGVRIGVAKTLEKHRLAGEKIVIWEKGRIIEILPPKQPLRKLMRERKRLLEGQ